MTKTRKFRKIAFKRIASLFTVLCMVLCLFPASFGLSASADTVAYSQYDSRWGSWVYGKGTIAGTGCGILSTVNAFNYLDEIGDVGAAIDEVATWAHDINGFNGTWGPDGGTDRTVVYPRLEAKFGQKYNITVPSANVWSDIYSEKLRSHLSEYGNVAIAHVAYGHFIVLAEYDRTKNLFLVLDSAPTVSGNPGKGVAWLPPEQLNVSGNSRMHVDWFCLISSTSTAAPVEKDGDLYLTDGTSTDGFWGELGTAVTVKELDSKQGISISNADHCNDNSAHVGSMALLKYSGATFASAAPYNTVKVDLWCSEDYSSLADRQDDYFQINFISDISSQDGYNLSIPASQIKNGWNELTFNRSDIAKAVDSGDWTNIRRMRFTWFNVSNGQSVEFAVGGVRFTNSPVIPAGTEDGLLLSDGMSLAGFSAANGTELSVEKQTDENAISGYGIAMNNENCSGTGRMTLNIDSTVDATRYEKLSLVINCSIPYHQTDRRKDTFDIYLTVKGKEGGYRFTLKNYEIYGYWQKINLDLNRLICTDKSVDLSQIDTINFVWNNATGQEPVNFYVSSIEFTGKKEITYLYGDVDKSGTVEANDALYVLQNFVGSREFDEQTKIIADVDADGSITTKDALLVLQKAVKILDIFPCETIK